MSRLIMLFGVFFGFFASSTYAAEPKANGFFIGGSGGISEFDDDDLIRDIGLELDDEDSAFGILAGYRFGRNFALEARYTETGDFEVTDGFESVDIETDITDQWTVGAALRYEDYEEFDDSTDWKVSTRYDFTDSFALRATSNTGFRAPSPGQANTLNVTTFKPTGHQTHRDRRSWSWE